jgi:hypothetical protein
MVIQTKETLEQVKTQSSLKYKEVEMREYKQRLPMCRRLDKRLRFRTYF